MVGRVASGHLAKGDLRRALTGFSTVMACVALGSVGVNGPDIDHLVTGPLAFLDIGRSSPESSVQAWSFWATW